MYDWSAVSLIGVSEVTYAQAGVASHFPFRRIDFTGDDLDDGTLATAVGAHNAHPR